MFRRHGNHWVQQQKLLPPADAGSSFGSAVAINGDVILVGAPTSEPEGVFGAPSPDSHIASGNVYAFVRSHGAWNFATKLPRPTPAQDLQYWQFGLRILTEGDRAIISAGEFPSFLWADGVAFVYERSGNTVQPTALARFRDTHSMALAGRQLLLGSPYEGEEINEPFFVTAIGSADVYALPPTSH